jgi:hypothetical protein
MSVLELARAGTNRACVDCADRPLFGGLRCLPCFQRRCLQNAGEHLFAESVTRDLWCAAADAEGAGQVRRRSTRGTEANADMTGSTSRRKGSTG